MLQDKTLRETEKLRKKKKKATPRVASIKRKLRVQDSSGASRANKTGAIRQQLPACPSSNVTYFVYSASSIDSSSSGVVFTCVLRARQVGLGKVFGMLFSFPLSSFFFFLLLAYVALGRNV